MIGSKETHEGRFPALTLVIGGARSGKSSFAERLAAGSGRPLRYVATAEALDDEMKARIARHQADRGDNWLLVEEPNDLSAALAAAKPEEAVLVDCATLWLSNRLLAGADIGAETKGLLGSVALCSASLVIVSNEVGWSIVPENALARSFRDAQGRLNQALAAKADLVVAIMAGLPIVLKGALPDHHET